MPEKGRNIALLEKKHELFSAYVNSTLFAGAPIMT